MLTNGRKFKETGSKTLLLSDGCIVMLKNFPPFLPFQRKQTVKNFTSLSSDFSLHFEFLLNTIYVCVCFINIFKHSEATRSLIQVKNLTLFITLVSF